MYVPAVYAINKVDQITVEELELLSKMKHYVPISANKEWNLDGLLETVWDYLDMVRIYTKPRGTTPDYTDPVVLPRSRARWRISATGCTRGSSGVSRRRSCGD